MKTTILFVEHNEEVAQSVIGILASRESFVKHSKTPLNSIEEINRDDSIGVVIANFKLPGMSGLDLAETIRDEFRGRPWLQFLIVTNCNHISAVQQAIRIPIADFIREPVNPVELLRSVNIALLRCTKARSPTTTDRAEPYSRTHPADGEHHSRPDESRKGSHAKILAELARLKGKREALFRGPLFSDPCWDMMLEVLRHELAGGAIPTTSNVCLSAGVPISTALRKLQAMENAGLIERRRDSEDERRTIIKLTMPTKTGLLEYLEYCEAIFCAKCNMGKSA
jgi:FixJ family two-component response regulator/DNA-binding transcriptional ArsR family regulator